jgi:hypothetical protein
VVGRGGIGHGRGCAFVVDSVVDYARFPEVPGRRAVSFRARSFHATARNRESPRDLVEREWRSGLSAGLTARSLRLTALTRSPLCRATPQCISSYRVCPRRPWICTAQPAEMKVLARIRAGGREIECGLATTRRERAAVLAQRFRVYQRKGYYRDGLRVDRDRWDRQAVYFLALLRDEENGRVLLGSARLVVGESVPGFKFPTEEAFEMELPGAIRESSIRERAEVSRVVAEATHGVVIGGLLTPLGLLQAMTEYARPQGIRCGLAGIKQRLLRALRGMGVRLHEIHPAQLIYPIDGPLSGYCHQDSDPVVPVYWLTDEIVPSIEQAIARYQGGGT